MNRPIAYEGNEPYIFISYAHKDSDRVMPIIEGLYQRGFRVWYDAGIEAGTQWAKEISKHLSKCAYVVSFFANNFFQSENCLDEIYYAKDKKKGPLIVYLEKVELPEDVQLGFGRLHALNMAQYTSLESFLDVLCGSQTLSTCRSKNIQPSNRELEHWHQTGNVHYDKREYTEAVRWYRKAAEYGYARSQFNLGVCYNNGNGVTKDVVEAAKWYRKAAEHGHARAQYNLGNYYENGKGVTKDAVEAVKWYRKSAEQGYDRAQCSLGYCYEKGLGVIKDAVEAVHWYRKAAEQNYALAQYNLGCCYDWGNGVADDEAEAMKWHRKSAEQGYAEAQYTLASRYEYGHCVTRDEVEAVKWYRKAAEQGHVRAQCDLGVCYEEGMGVPKNEAEAARWYRKAAMQGYAPAQKALRRLHES